MRKTAILILLGLLTGVTQADATHEERIRELARDYMEAARTQDHERVVSLSYPPLVESIGGQTRMLQFLAMVDAKRRAQGVEYGDTTILSVSKVVTAGTQLHALVELEQQRMTPDGAGKIVLYFLAVSDDDGRSWTFTDVTKLDEDRTREMFPQFNEELKLPSTSPSP